MRQFYRRHCSLGKSGAGSSFVCAVPEANRRDYRPSVVGRMWDVASAFAKIRYDEAIAGMALRVVRFESDMGGSLL